MRGDFPLSFRGSGVSPGKLWCRRSVLKPTLGQNVRFLNFESQLDIHYATFALIQLILVQKLANKVKRKCNDQELMKYLINNCGSFWIIRV